MPSRARSTNICLGKDFKAGDTSSAVTHHLPSHRTDAPGTECCARIGPRCRETVPNGGCTRGKPVQVQRGGLQRGNRRDEKYHAQIWKLCFSSRAMQQLYNGMEAAWSREVMWNNATAQNKISWSMVFQLFWILPRHPLLFSAGL
ncbi:hypothetical protein AV530_009767 [Patagioenas fasciata monilis]|uniref:Uncharacterized protein n=1 Tax=Patagioenas fasciata monilis TaxID=372326 RepID=A0A1V4KA47_PATFA|nr:hypothetical protein AV530_009767 [Patagioenas fasciata monilis]